MLESLLNEGTVQVINGKNLDWRKVIELASNPLLKEGSIEKEYVKRMIKNVEEQGPYINIGPKIALAHARPEGGVNKISLSFLKTNQVVNLLNEHHPINLWFVLSAVDNQSHLDLIKDLMKLLTNDEKIELLLNAKSKKQILEIINSGR